MQIGVPREIATGERRVALIPESLKSVAAAGGEVTIERGAGVEAGFLDEAYQAQGQRILRADVDLPGNGHALHGGGNLHQGWLARRRNTTSEEFT